MSLTIEEINDLSRLDPLEGEWANLLSRCPHRSLFLTLEWVKTWYRCFRGDATPRILVVRRNGDAVLIAPLMRYCGPAFRHLSGIKTRMNHSASNYHSNRFDFIYEELRRECLELIWTYLHEESGWHLLRLFPVLNSSMTLSGLEALAGETKIPASLIPSQTSPYLKIDSSWEEYSESISSSEMRRKGRKAEREEEKGNLHFELLDGRAEELDVTLSEIFEVADSAWAGKEGTAISSTPALRGFYSDLAHLANRRRWLYFSLLRVDGRLAAFAYNLKYEGRIYNLKVAYHPDFRKVNPGHSLTWLTLSSVFSRSGEIREFDFLGDNDPYKSKWTSQMRYHSKLTLYNERSLYARLVYVFERGVVERARQMKRRRRSNKAQIG